MNVMDRLAFEYAAFQRNLAGAFPAAAAAAPGPPDHMYAGDITMGGQLIAAPEDPPFAPGLIIPYETLINYLVGGGLIGFTIIGLLYWRQMMPVWIVFVIACIAHIGFVWVPATTKLDR